MTPVKGSLRGVVTAPLSCNLSARFVLCGPSGVGGVRDGAPGEYTRVYRIESVALVDPNKSRPDPRKMVATGCRCSPVLGSQRARSPEGCYNEKDFSSSVGD